MNYSCVSLPEIFIVGVAIRTTNSDGKAFQDIPAFWQYVQEENRLDGIVSSEPQKIYAIYTDYAADGSYAMIIGKRVASLEHLPAGMVSCAIAASEYALFTAQGQEFGEAVGKLWAAIWQLPLERAFTADFEVYDAALLSKPTPEVPVYVALK